MRAKCIDNTGLEGELTLNRIYEVKDNGLKDLYWVELSDRGGIQVLYLRSRFEPCV